MYRPGVRPSVRLSRRSTAAAACGWFAAERQHPQQISIDSYNAAHALEQQIQIYRHVETERMLLYTILSRHAVAR